MTGAHIQDWRGVCLPMDRAVYNIIMTVFTLQDRRRRMSVYQPNTQLNYCRQSYLYN